MARKKGIVERTAEELEKAKEDQDKANTNTDSAFIQKAISTAEKLKGAVSSSGDAFLVKDFIRAYDLTVPISGKPMPEKVVAFTFNRLTGEVLDFLLTNALNNNLSKMINVTENCVLVGKFKVLG